MSEKAERVIERSREMIREVTDPVEFQKQFREMLEEEFPAPPAPPRQLFVQGETMPMHRFMSRLQTEQFGGVMPRFYGAEVEFLGASPDNIYFALARTGAGNRQQAIVGANNHSPVQVTPASAVTADAEPAGDR